MRIILTYSIYKDIIYMTFNVAYTDGNKSNNSGKNGNNRNKGEGLEDEKRNS